MTRNGWIWLGLLGWVGLYAASFLVPWGSEPTGDGFTRGLNRVLTFIEFQVGAAVAALVVWVAGTGLAKGTWLRRATRVPLALAVALFLFIVGLILWSNFAKPGQNSAPPPSGPTTTAPAADAVTPAKPPEPGQ